MHSLYRSLLILPDERRDLTDQSGEEAALHLSRRGHRESLGGDVVDGTEGQCSNSAGCRENNLVKKKK